MMPLPRPSGQGARPEEFGRNAAIDAKNGPDCEVLRRRDESYPQRLTERFRSVPLFKMI